MIQRDHSLHLHDTECEIRERKLRNQHLKSRIFIKFSQQVKKIWNRLQTLIRKTHCCCGFNLTLWAGCRARCWKSKLINWIDVVRWGLRTAAAGGRESWDGSEVWGRGSRGRLGEGVEAVWEGNRAGSDVRQPEDWMRRRRVVEWMRVR